MSEAKIHPLVIRMVAAALTVMALIHSTLPAFGEEPSILLLDEHHFDPGPGTNYAPPGASSYAIMLGSGMPYPNPFRNGPAVAVVVDGETYLFDVGEGIWRGMARAALLYRGRVADALRPANVTHLFITHLHQDHVSGFPALLLPGADLSQRKVPLQVFGPPGTKALAEGVVSAYDYSLELSRAENPEGGKVIARDIDPRGGLVYTDAKVKIEALRVPHGNLNNAFSYKITTADRVFLISGDVSGDQSEKIGADRAMVEFAKDADVLIHEVVTLDSGGFTSSDRFLSGISGLA